MVLSISDAVLLAVMISATLISFCKLLIVYINKSSNDINSEKGDNNG